ncbi:putative sodium/dicarboxylate cotransporter [Helicobacter cinaedi]|uniref:Putative sodium/dicarboxylate cotransporter n=1 Tax=Helicobacter cinaedi TaxID=213 RepID=A0A377JN76_9HELI|nr:putative sodium/dicarboxylate cotransporter [Helicobacter cinaedi]
MPQQSNHQSLQSTLYEETHTDDSRTHLDLISQDSILDSTSQESTKFTQSTPQDSAKEATLKEERTIKIILGVGIALIFGIIAAILARVYLGASFKVSALLGIIALLVTLWTNKALPLGVVSLLPIILFPSFGILDTKSATENYANPIIYLFLGGFMLATATEKIGLHKIIAKKFFSFFP